MLMPGFTAENSLRSSNSRHRGRRDAAALNAGQVQPQAETCDYGFIGEGHDLYIVCCDPDRSPPCVAWGLV